MADTRSISPSGLVTARIIDGEAMLINLSTGLYYSMTDAASHIWSLIEQNQCAEHIARSLARHYHVPYRQAAADVERLVSELAREGLVHVSGARVDGADTVEKLHYAAPKLERFSDMVELFGLNSPLAGPAGRAH